MQTAIMWRCFITASSLGAEGVLGGNDSIAVGVVPGECWLFLLFEIDLGRALQAGSLRCMAAPSCAVLDHATPRLCVSRQGEEKIIAPALVEAGAMIGRRVLQAWVGPALARRLG